jgi:hypothetical protein
VTPETLQLLNLLLLPIAGLLWKISTQLAAVVATQAAHHGRLESLERAA